ncbi:hypothetical protein [Fischerella sp. PCC 9605]|uniref:hypothetical protein n=1 Tax=Fischerella sp. PCC 9605 TaxID=1173024 RepID=UPI00047B5548|nr:hypothetical protein [Fischerella sp. PCC 9605]
MKNRHWFEQFMVLLSVSAILAISCPNVVRAQGYNPNPRLYSHRGRLFQQIDNRLYYPDLQTWKNQGVPIGTTVTIEGDSAVILEYRWPSDIPNVPCISRVVMNNRGQYTRWFSYQVKKYDIPGRCNITSDNELPVVQQRLAQDPSIVRVTFYGQEEGVGGKPDWWGRPARTPTDQESQSYRRENWFWRALRYYGITR